MTAKMSGPSSIKRTSGEEPARSYAHFDTRRRLCEPGGCPTCGGAMTYQSALGHYIHPDDAITPYFYCANRECNQRDLEAYPPHEPMRTRWGRYGA